MIFFILIYFASYIYILHKNLSLGLSILLFTLPLYLIRFKIFGIFPSTFLEIHILLCFSFWFLTKTNFKNFLKDLQKQDKKNTFKKYLKQLKENRKKRPAYPFTREIITVLLISYFSFLFSGQSIKAFGIWRAYFFEPLLVYILILNIFFKEINNQKKDKLVIFYEKIFFPLTLSASFLSLLAIIQKLSNKFIINNYWHFEAQRITSIFPYPNALALFLGPIFFLTCGYFLYLHFSPKDNKKKLYLYKIACIVEILIIGIAICLSQSKGALLSISISFGLFAFLINKKSRIFILIIYIIFGMIIFQNPNLKNKTQELFFLKNLSGEIRKQQWRETKDFLQDNYYNFFFGSGLANYQNKIKSYHQEGIFYNFYKDPDFKRKIVIFDEHYKKKHWQGVEIYLYPHNFFLNFWVELGFFGMIIFTWILLRASVLNFSYFRKENTNTRFLALGTFFALQTILIHGLVDVPYFKNDLSILFWILIAYSGIIELIKNSKK